MSFQILFVLCLGIAFTPWVENKENSIVLPSIENILPELELNLNNYTLTRFKAQDCNIKVNGDIKEPQPLFVIPDSTEFYNPDNSGIIRIPKGAEIEFHCNKGFEGKHFKNLESIRAKCKDGHNFEVKGQTYTFNSFVCTKKNAYTARSTTRKCYDNSVIAEIGFELKNNKFIKIMELCHNEHTGSTYYVQHSLSPFNIHHQLGVDRPSFQQGKFFKSISVNKMYTIAEQIKTVGKILGGSHTKYFENGEFLGRGHLAAKSDFVYGTQQLGTFFYINAAPQWQSFNSGNWLSVEDSVKAYVAKKKLNADLYTGTWGVTSLKDRSGKFQEIFLFLNGDGNKIPAPKLFYKIVIDRKSRKGIVLLGVNNPHLSLAEIKKDYIICTDISDKINWINWKKDDISKGYSYACSVPDFQNVVHHLPNLNVNGILV